MIYTLGANNLGNVSEKQEEEEGMMNEKKIHIPSSLMKKKKNIKKMSHRDISNIMHIQKNPELLKKYRRTRAPPQRIKDDFITMYLVKWPLHDIVKATSLLIGLMNHQNETSWRDDSFANHTPISYIDDGFLHTVSFKRYYEMLYDSALEKYRLRVIEDAGVKDHLTSLLRACFVIGFIHDVRIRRFIMANHSIHANYTLTRPPDPENANVFIYECTHIVNTYLSSSDLDEHVNILSMIDQCSRIWIHNCMI